MKSMIIIVTVLVVSFGEKLPSDWLLCKGSKELGKCLAPAIEYAVAKMKNGVPELNIPPLDPVILPSVTIEGGGSVNVVQNYKNFQIIGFSTAKISKVDATYTSEGLTMDIEAITAQGKFIADYDLNGHVLLLPVVGNGKCEVTLKNFKLNGKFLFKKIEKKGVKYLKVTSVEIEFTTDKVTFNFEKLFNDHPILGPEMNKLINENWKVVFSDVKSGYGKILENVIADYADKVFSQVPVDEIF